MRLLIGVLLLLAAAPEAQSTPEVEFQIQVAVENAQRAFLRSSGTELFDALVDGRPARLVSIDWSDTPASVVLLIDRSASATWNVVTVGPDTRFDQRRLIRAVQVDFIGTLSPIHHLQLARFAGRHVGVSEWFSGDRAGALAATERLVDPGTLEDEARVGPSPIWDAVHDVVRRLATETGRNAVVLVTDGAALGSGLGMEEVASYAAALRVPVHVIFQPAVRGTNTRIDPTEIADVSLRALASRTGGVFRVDDGVERSTVGVLFSRPGEPVPFRDVTAAIHQTGILTVRAALSDQTTVPLEIRARRPGLVVHAPRTVHLTPRASTPLQNPNAGAGSRVGRTKGDGALAPLTSAMREAARRGDMAAVGALLDADAPIEASDPDGATALYHAASAGRGKVLRLLLDRGANVDAALLDGRTPLMAATLAGSLESCQLLVQAGADVNGRTARGTTPLMQAARSASEAVVAYLLAQAADPRISDAMGRSAADVAYASRHLAITKLLVQAMFPGRPDTDRLAANRDLEDALQDEMRAWLAVASRRRIAFTLHAVSNPDPTTGATVVYADAVVDAPAPLPLDFVKHFVVHRDPNGALRARLVTW